MNPATYTIETTRHLLADEGFKSRHRASAQAFTRVRRLPWCDPPPPQADVGSGRAVWLTPKWTERIILA